MTTIDYLQYGILIILLSIFVVNCYTQISQSMIPEDRMLTRLRSRLIYVHPVIEHLKLFKGRKSYTINKKKVYLCLTDKDGNYYDENMLCYVLLHEVAHVLCDEIGHTEKFHRIFTFLQARAARLGVFDPNRPIIQNYCKY